MIRRNGYQQQLARALRRSGERLTDAEIIDACLMGRSLAWNALLERYEALMYSVALGCGLTNADAADVFQEVSLILLERLEGLRDSARLSSWLLTVTRREALRHRRKRAVALETDMTEEGRESLLDSIPDPDTEPETILLQLEERLMVRLALEQVSEECQRLLTRLYLDEPPASYQQAALELRRPVGSIGPTRARCLKHLLEIFEKNIT